MIGRLMPTRSSRLWPGLAGHARGDDEHVAPAQSAQSRCRDLGVVAEDGAVLLEVERLALREVGLRGMSKSTTSPSCFAPRGRELAADVACADERDLLARRR
jgi:hypothetical protein